MGFVYTLLGVLGVVFIGYLHYRLSIWTNGAICLPVLQSLLYPFGGLLLIVGVYLACLPPKYSGSACRGCGYDLAGARDRRPRVPGVRDPPRAVPRGRAALPRLRGAAAVEGSIRRFATGAGRCT